MRKILIIISITIAAMACRREIDEDIPFAEPKPVVYGIMCADSLLSLHLSISGQVNATAFDTVSNAVVWLFQDDVAIEQLSYTGRGWYTTSMPLPAGHTYRCEIDIPGYERVTCTDSIPMPQKILDAKYNRNVGIDNDNGPYGQLVLKFTNNPNSKRYFSIATRPVPGYMYSNLNYVIDYQTDMVLLNENRLWNGIAFSNELINTESYTLHVNYFVQSNALIFELQTISYNLYAYTLQMQQYRENLSPEIGQHIVPTYIESNITNGYGLFAGYSIDLSEPVIDLK